MSAGTYLDYNATMPLDPRVLAALHPPLLAAYEDFLDLFKGSFQKRRKMLKSSLREVCLPSLIEKALIEQGLNPLARPEDLSLDSFIALASSLFSCSGSFTISSLTIFSGFSIFFSGFGAGFFSKINFA